MNQEISNNSATDAADEETSLKFDYSLFEGMFGDNVKYIENLNNVT